MDSKWGTVHSITVGAFTGTDTTGIMFFLQFAVHVQKGF